MWVRVGFAGLVTEWDTFIETRLISRGVRKTESQFGFRFKNWTVQKFDIRSDGFPTETVQIRNLC